MRLQQELSAWLFPSILVFCVKRERSRCVRGVVVVDSVVIVGGKDGVSLTVLCVVWADRQCDGKCVCCVCGVRVRLTEFARA